MTVEPQHFFVDALTGSDGTGAARSRLVVPYVFPDATAAFAAKRPAIPAGRSLSGHSPTQLSSARTQPPYPLPGPLTPSRPDHVAPVRAATPVSVTADMPYNPCSMAGNLDVVAGPVPAAAIPPPFTQTPRPAVSGPMNSRPSGGQNGQSGQNVQRPGAHGRSINQGAVYHRQPPTPLAQQSHQPQIPAALMAWLPPNVAAQIPMANRPPVAGSQPFGRQPAQQPPTQQFDATPLSNLEQRRLRDQQRLAQRSTKKSGGKAFFVLLFLILIFTGLGREILDAIVDALNK